MKRPVIHRFGKLKPAQDYSSIAAFYDRIMDHVDYTAWTEYIEMLFRTYGHGVRCVLEGGCGTGVLAFRLQTSGFRVAGFDRSYAMTALARERIDGLFWQGDLRALSVRSGWDAFICLYDTIQYLSMAEVEALSQNVHSILNPGGLFIFDVVTEQHIRRYWADYTEVDGGEDWEILRRSWYSAADQVQHTEIDLQLISEKRAFREHHHQFIFSLDAVAEVCRRTGWHVAGMFEDFSLEPADEASDRVHFVLQRRET